MTPDAVQTMVDAFGGLGALSVAGVLGVRKRRTTVQNVLLLVFLLAGLFYAARASAALTGVQALSLASLILACALPLGALLLAEILLRRHAPLPVKLFVAGGTAVGVTAAVLAGVGMERAFSLAVYVPLALTAILGLILWRDRSGLGALENATLDSYARALGFAGLLTLTDFGLGSPFGLSALGILGLAYAAAGGAAASNRWLDTIRDLGLATLTALLLAGALLWLRPVASATEAAGVLAVVSAAFLALSVLLRLRSGGGDQRRRVFDATLAQADVSNLDRFVQDMSRAPPLQGLALLEERDLTGYDVTRLAAAFDVAPVLSLPGLIELDPEAAEQLRDLLARHASTHALLLASRPMRIGLVAVGGSVLSVDDECAMRLFQRTAVLVAGREGTTP